VNAQVSHRRLTSRTAVVVLHAFVFAALAYWSWRKWPDPLIDFGRELYVPWQITRGRVLYQDLASLFGPLSPYVNALWFSLFGPSLMTLAACNLAIFALCVAGIHHLIASATDRITATAASLSTMLLCGFSQYIAVGNYNFVTPYSHEATHGFALMVGMLVCLHHAIPRGRRVFHVAAGLCFGLVLLTKPETALAAAAGAGAAFLAAGLLISDDRRSIAKAILVFVASALVPAVLFLAYFASKMEISEAIRSVAGAWTTPNSAAIVRNDFYLRGLGLDDPAGNLLRTLQVSAGFLMFVAAAAAISWRQAGDAPPPSKAVRLGRLALLVATILALREGTFPRALPLVSVLALAASVVIVRSAMPDRERAVRLLPLVTWSACACVLLAKLGLNARIAHYGFYLALPAVVAGIVLVCWMIPLLLERWSRRPAGPGFRQLAVWALIAAIAPYLGMSHGWYRTKVFSVGSGPDRFYASADGWQGPAVQAGYERLVRAAAPDATIAVLPEGVMLNYLLRRDSPLRVVNVMPPEVLAFGEQDVLGSLVGAPPTFVVLVHKDTGEYGYPLFGSDARYGLRVVEWVRSNYRTVEVIGERPLADGGAGLEILERRD
jgi:hypothetical protein